VPVIEPRALSTPMHLAKDQTRGARRPQKLLERQRPNGAPENRWCALAFTFAHQVTPRSTVRSDL